MYPNRRRDTRGPMTLEKASRLGFGEPLFFVNGESLDFGQGECIDHVTGAAGTLQGALSIVSGPYGDKAILFNAGHVDFGFLNLYEDDADEILVMAMIRPTLGFASYRVLLSQDNGTTASRIWAFGLASAGQHNVQIRYASTTRGGSEAYGNYSSTVRALVDRWQLYGFSVQNKTLEQDTTHPDIPNVLSLNSNHPNSAGTLGDGYLKLKSISQSKLVLGSSLTSGGARTAPFYGAVAWVGVWRHRMNGQGEVFGFTQKHKHMVGSKVFANPVMPELARRTFYVDYSHWPRIVWEEYEDIHTDLVQQNNLQQGGIYRVTAQAGVQPLHMVTMGEVVSEHYYPLLDGTTYRTENYEYPRYAGDIVGARNTESRTTHYGKMLKDLSGLSPETPAVSADKIARMVRPGDTVLFSVKHAFGYVSYQNLVGYNSGEGNTIDMGGVLGANVFNVTRYPTVRIGYYDPDTGEEVDSPAIKPYEFFKDGISVAGIGLMNGVFAVSGAYGVGVDAEGARVTIWGVDTAKRRISLDRSNAIIYGCSSAPGTPSYNYGTLNLNYPTMVGYDYGYQGEGGRPVQLSGSYAECYRYRQRKIQVPFGLFESKLRAAHSIFEKTVGDTSHKTSVLVNQQAPGGSVLECFGCDVGEKTNITNNTTDQPNTARSLGLYVIRSSAVHPAHGSYQLGKSRLQTEVSTLVYPLAMVGKEVNGFLHSVKVLNGYSYTPRSRDPARSSYYIEWRFFWPGLKSDIEITHEFLGVVGSWGQMESFAFPMAVYYTDTEGEYAIYRDDENQTFADAATRDFSFQQTVTDDRWYRDVSLPSPENHYSGKRVVPLYDVGKGFVTVRLYPFTRFTNGYLSPALEVV